MSSDDASRWDVRYRSIDPESIRPRAPEALEGHTDQMPRSGRALDVACGAGAVSLWLAAQGLTVHGIDASTVAVDLARAAAGLHGLDPLTDFEVWDLDHGLARFPDATYDVVVCQRFRDPSLYPELVRVLRPGGLLAVSVLSEVGGEPGRFRASAGELVVGLGDRLDVLVSSERDGLAVLAGRRRL